MIPDVYSSTLPLRKASLSDTTLSLTAYNPSAQ